MYNLREDECRGRPPDVPRIITTASFPICPEGAPHLQFHVPLPWGRGLGGWGAAMRQCLFCSLSVSGSRRCHLSRGERQKRFDVGVGVCYALAPPKGELSPQVTDTRPQAGVHSAPCRRQVWARSRGIDIPRYNRKCCFYAVKHRINHDIINQL